MEAINKKTCIDALYELTFKGEFVRVYARSDKQAIQRAIEYFRPHKRDRDLVQIHLVVDELLNQCTAENRHSEVFSDSCGKELL